MRLGIFLALLTGLSTSVAVQAEPAKAPATKTGQPAEKRPVVIASISADSQREMSKAEQSDDQASAKPRRARVTTCRCGDQTPNND